jgi:hypothetical protein
MAPVAILRLACLEDSSHATSQQALDDNRGAGRRAADRPDTRAVQPLADDDEGSDLGMRPNDQLPAVATGWPARRAVIAIAAALIVGLLGGAALVRPLAKSATAPVSQFVFVGQTRRLVEIVTPG